jgi:hypothetical protein
MSIALTDTNECVVSCLMTSLYLHLRLFHIGLLILHNVRLLGIRLVTFLRNLRKKLLFAMS